MRQPSFLSKKFVFPVMSFLVVGSLGLTLNGCKKKTEVKSDDADSALVDENYEDDSELNIPVQFEMQDSVLKNLSYIAANGLFGIYEDSAVDLYINDKLIVMGSRTLEDDYEIIPSTFVHDATVTDAEITAYNSTVSTAIKDMQANFDTVLAASSCSFKANDFSQLFPEFPVYVKYWSEYIASDLATDYNKGSLEKKKAYLANRPTMISKEEFVKRMGCLGTLTAKPAVDLPWLETHDKVLSSEVVN